MKSCVWSQDEESNWTTECGEVFTLIKGTPIKNNMFYCCYCGDSLIGKEIDNDDYMDKEEID